MEHNHEDLAARFKIDTESPTSSQIAVLRLAGAGLLIPDDLMNNVLDSAERGKNTLRGLIEESNKSINDPGSTEFTLRENFLRLAAQIAFSRGFDDLEACRIRLEHINQILYSSDPGEEGVGFTE